MRKFSAAALVACSIAISLPVRRDVAGLSMAPDLMPEDRVMTNAMPWRDRWRSPATHERWVVMTPDGTEAVKRVAASGPATLRIVDGDLELDGRIEAPPPAVLLQRATVVRETGIAAGREETLLLADGEEILDDAAFAPNERRVLLPVADVGACVIVRVDRDAAAGPAEEVVIRVGDRSVRWRPSGPGAFAFLAGRVDGQMVGVAWRLREMAHEGDADRDGRPLRLPSDPPSAWSVAEAWAGADAEGAPRLTISVGGRDHAPAADDVAVERAILWRDVFYRPAADGTTEWSLAAGEVFLLGDFPSGSIDSRQFGPIPRGSLHHRVTAVFRRTSSGGDRGEHPVGLVEHGHAAGPLREPLDRLGRVGEAEGEILHRLLVER